MTDLDHAVYSLSAVDRAQRFDRDHLRRLRALAYRMLGFSAVRVKSKNLSVPAYSNRPGGWSSGLTGCSRRRSSAGLQDRCVST
jgi:hypothetical protein